jgi:hypothetical protein
VAKHIILVHGRAIKPADAVLRELAKKALEEGVKRAGGAGLRDANGNAVTFSSAYFGDISNQILGRSASVAQKLTETDPLHGNMPCFPRGPLDRGFELTTAFPRFDKARYQKVLAEASDMRWLDEAADWASSLAGLLTGGFLNLLGINVATEDLGAYLTSHNVGSAVRGRLDALLRPALLRQDDVCLITHSMGCMVAYDLMWKYAHMSEYADFRDRQRKVSKWVTLGNPLGEVGVRRNLLDGRYGEAEKYPSNQIEAWTNIFAEDDFISHVAKLAPEFKSNAKTGLPKIVDKKIYNCWVYEDMDEAGRLTSNPHDLYGYLMNPTTAQEVIDWLA